MQSLTGPLNGWSNFFPLSFSTALSVDRVPWSWQEPLNQFDQDTRLTHLQYVDMATSGSNGVGQRAYHVLGRVGGGG